MFFFELWPIVKLTVYFVWNTLFSYRVLWFLYVDELFAVNNLVKVYKLLLHGCLIDLNALSDSLECLFVSNQFSFQNHISYGIEFLFKY